MRIADTELNSDRRRGSSRRELLRGGMLAAMATGIAPLAACGLLDRGPEPAPEPDPLAPLITSALDLAARHEAAITAHPELGDLLRPIATAHRAHAEELARVTHATLPTTVGSGTPAGATPSAGTPGGDARTTRAELRGAEQRERDAAAAVCAAAPANRAALVGSIAAARATHVEVLK